MRRCVPGLSSLARVVLVGSQCRVCSNVGCVILASRGCVSLRRRVLLVSSSHWRWGRRRARYVPFGHVVFRPSQSAVRGGMVFHQCLFRFALKRY